ncbi:MAG TPA: hypothetical protein VJH23_00810 [archaeon]|nr:hypothetical protein [archaeon]
MNPAPAVNSLKSNINDSGKHSFMLPDFSPDIAEICGIHAGDGYLRNEGYQRELDISGNIDEKEYYDSHVVPLFERVFGISITAKIFPARQTYGFVIRDRKIVEFMHSLGFPYGEKTYDVSVPEFIMNSRNLDVIYSFIRGVFDTDGCLTFQKRTGSGYKSEVKKKHAYPVIQLGVCSKNLSHGLYSLFRKTGFNCKTGIRKPTTENESVQYVLYLRGYSTLENWMHNIGFKNTSKSSRYEVWTKFGFCPTHLSFKQRSQILNNELDPNSFYPVGP